MRSSQVVLAVLVLASGCAGETPAPPEPPTPPPAVTTTATAPTPPSTPSTPGKCDFTLHLGTGADTTSGDNPQIVVNNGLFVSCANGPLLQLRGDRETPALAVDFEGGKQTRLVQGDTATVGPYQFNLLEQSGNGGRQLRFKLTLN